MKIVKSAKEFILFLWDRYFRKCRNIGYGRCNWNCSYRAEGPQRILLDEGMCWPCYESYIEDYK